MEHIGMDLGKMKSQVCIVTDSGELLQRRIRTERGELLECFGKRPKARILVEASTESEWVARCLEAAGHEVIVGDPNYAPMYSQRSRRVKTDQRDADALAQACCLGAYRPAHRTSDEQQHVRALLGVREALIQSRTRWIALSRSLLRREGIRVRSGSSKSFVTRVEEVSLPEHLKEEVVPLLACMTYLNARIEFLNRQLRELARKDEVSKRLMTAPGVASVIALSFVAALDRVERFRGPHQVEAYLGLVPGEWSSSEVRRRGHITKAGNTRARWLLVQAAHCVLRGGKKPRSATLREWADRIAQRRGKSIAAVALARRIAGILYAMWRDGTVYDPAKVRSPVGIVQAA